MRYLTKDNKPTRITTKQLSGFRKAKANMLSANDAYNKHKYGIESLEYRWIAIAVQSISGSLGPMPKLAQINKWLAEPKQYDSDGYYLTYLSRRVAY